MASSDATKVPALVAKIKQGTVSAYAGGVYSYVATGEGTPLGDAATDARTLRNLSLVHNEREAMLNQLADALGIKR